MAKKEKTQAIEPPASPSSHQSGETPASPGRERGEPFTQKPTIRDAVTYIVPASPGARLAESKRAHQGGDEQGNEIKKTDTETQGHGDTEK